MFSAKEAKERKLWFRQPHSSGGRNSHGWNSRSVIEEGSRGQRGCVPKTSGLGWGVSLRRGDLKKSINAAGAKADQDERPGI